MLLYTYYKNNNLQYLKIKNIVIFVHKSRIKIVIFQAASGLIFVYCYTQKSPFKLHFELKNSFCIIVFFSGSIDMLFSFKSE